MEAYRDQYATLFNNGRKVVVVGISVDADTTQASWARDSEFPILFASDTAGRVGAMYGAYDEKNKTDNRSLYVIAPDGKIVMSFTTQKPDEHITKTLEAVKAWKAAHKG
jgi:peroxiredoxin